MQLVAAQAIYEIAVNEMACRPTRVDPPVAPTFTLARWAYLEFAHSVVETLEGIRLIKRHLPGVLCSLGVSNLSFGLALPTRGRSTALLSLACGAGRTRYGDHQPQAYAALRRNSGRDA